MKKITNRKIDVKSTRESNSKTNGFEFIQKEKRILPLDIEIEAKQH